MGRCADCGRKVSLFNPFRLGENCCKCGVRLCKKCVIYSENGPVCRGCHFGRKGNCFIATACYGYRSNEVNILKNWRDKKLLRNNIGKVFVKNYYYISPQISKFISNKPSIKRIIRKLLNPITKVISKN